MTREKIRDTVSLEMLDRMKACDMETAWDRYEAQQPQCGYGKLGVCCKVCNMGPCVISPFDDGPKRGICGADADTIVARNFVRLCASGVACHSDHGRSVAELLVGVARGEAQGYDIKDEAKLRKVARDLGIDPAGKSTKELAEAVGLQALAEFGKPTGTQLFAKRAPEKRQKVWDKYGIRPRAIDREVVEALHRTSMGVDQDYRSLLRFIQRLCLADGWGGSMIGTELQDILFGTPKPVRGEVNLGVLKDDTVNVIIHGHEPILSEMIAVAAQDPELIAAAKKVGAAGITIAGICCTANELLIRHGVPVAGNMKMQELALATGAVEAIVVDVQCIMQGGVAAAGKFHTKFITTSPKAQIAGATHIEFHEHTALDTAKKIIREAIGNFPKRDKSKVHIPKSSEEAVVGFSHETILYMLGGRFRSSYRPLNDNIMNGRIRGVVGVVGCTNPKVSAEEQPYITLIKRLIARDFLVVQTGCAALDCAKHGLMTPEVREMAGPGLREVCDAVGIPPVLHAGSCVDNSRILVAVSEMVKEGGLGEDISDLPVAGACFEWMHEKALAIGQYFVSSGVYTLFGLSSPFRGSEAVYRYLTEEIEQEVGGRWGFPQTVEEMADSIMAHIESKRDALGINKARERKLFDMEDRRKLTV